MMSKSHHGAPRGQDQPRSDRSSRSSTRLSRSPARKRRTVSSFRLRETGAGEPQGADGAIRRRASRSRSREARLQVPSREERQGRGAWEESRSAARHRTQRFFLRDRAPSAPSLASATLPRSGRASVIGPARRRGARPLFDFAACLARGAARAGVGRVRAARAASVWSAPSREQHRGDVCCTARREPRRGSRRSARGRRTAVRRRSTTWARSAPPPCSRGRRVSTASGCASASSRCPSDAARSLAGRAGVGLYAWRGGSALWTLREAAS